MKNLLQHCLLLVGILAITACGGGGSGGGSKPPDVVSSTPLSSSSSSSVAVVSSSAISVESSSAASSVASSAAAISRPPGEVTVTYSVTVDVPSSFLTQAAEAASTTLNASRFAVIVVDLAGNILQNVPLYDGEVVLNNDGSWSVSFPSSPRLDYLIVVDINKPIQVTVGGNIRQNDLVYAPITRNVVDIDVGSTAAYSNFLEELGGTGTFASKNFDPTNTANINLVEELVNGVQEIVAEKSLSQFSSVTNALTSLNTEISAVVTQEVMNIDHAVAGTAVSLIRDEGGMYTYQAFDDGSSLDINYDALIGTADLASYHYNGSAFVPATTTAVEQDLVLSASGWATPGNGTKVTAYNDDGSVITTLINAEGVRIKLEAEQVFDLAGRNIHDFLQADADTQGVTVDTTKTFDAGSKGYRIKASFLDTMYVVPLDAATESAGVCDTTDKNDGVAAATLGGNCNALGLWGANQVYTGTAASLANIFSADLTPDEEGFTAITLFDPVVVQLLNDSAKTARFYIQTAITADSETAQTILIGTGTWSNVVLPYLTEDATAIRVQMTNPLEDINYLLPDLQYLLVKQAGFVRLGFGIDPSVDVETSFNHLANTSILNALTQGNVISASPSPSPSLSSLPSHSILRQTKMRYLQ